MNKQDIIEHIHSLPVKSGPHNTLEEAVQWCKNNGDVPPFLITFKRDGVIEQVIVHEDDISYKEDNGSVNH